MPLETSAERPPGASPSMYLPTLDGPRFIAFALVFIHHLPRSELPLLGFLHDQGWVGVHIFLALSAYLLTLILGSEQAACGKISVRRFFIRRALRIWPLYLTFCAIVVLLVLARTGWNDSLNPRLAGLVFFVDNIATGIHGFNPLPFTSHLWTVSLEEQFYVVLPFMLRSWLLSRRRLATGLFTAWLLFLSTRAFGVALGAAHPLVWTSVVSADALLVGTALGAIGWKPGTGSLPRFLVLAGAALGIFSGGFWDDLQGVGLHQVVVYATVGMGAGLLLVAALHEPLLAFLASRPLRYLGKISFGLYVFHLLGIGLGTRLGASIGIEDWWFVAAASMLVTTVLSVLSYELLEKGFLRLKRRFEAVHTRPV